MMKFYYSMRPYDYWKIHCILYHTIECKKWEYHEIHHEEFL